MIKLILSVSGLFFKNWFASDFFSYVTKYGCSLIILFSKKYLCFLQNIHYLLKKIILYGKKNLYWFFVLLKKLFLQKMKKVYILFEKCFLIQKIYIHHSAKKIFLIIKNIFVKYLLNLVNSVIWSLNFQKHPICDIP